jgi:hypothetical protein
MASTTSTETNGNGTLPLYVPRLARETEPCAHCGALLASDQRYCLSCGERRAGTRVPFPETPAAVPAAATPAPAPRAIPRHGPNGMPDWAMSALFGLAGAAALALGILAGLLIAGGGDDNTPPPVAVASTPVASATPSPTVPAATSTPTATVAATFTADWPTGQNGWTVQLKTLPKDGTTPDAIAAAKREAAGQGAADVGALDSDTFPSLDGGNYVIYSGVHNSKEDAESALSGIQANFPDAEVVEVKDTADATPTPTAVTKSKDDLKKQEQSQSVEDAQKNTRKAPPTVESEGTPPPADDKAPGGGSDATEIG